MPTITADQRRKLAERIGVDPWTMTGETLIAKATEMSERVAAHEASRKARKFAEMADAFDDYMGIEVADRGRIYEQGDELRDPTGGLLDLR
jgi:hypothetical protein